MELTLTPKQLQVIGLALILIWAWQMLAITNLYNELQAAGKLECYNLKLINQTASKCWQKNLSAVVTCQTTFGNFSQYNSLS